MMRSTPSCWDFVVSGIVDFLSLRVLRGLLGVERRHREISRSHWSRAL